VTRLATLIRAFTAAYGTRRLAVELVAGPLVVGLVAAMLAGAAVVL
jgi:hypothetical protein